MDARAVSQRAVTLAWASVAVGVVFAAVTCAVPSSGVGRRLLEWVTVAVTLLAAVTALRKATWSVPKSPPADGWHRPPAWAMWLAGPVIAFGYMGLAFGCAGPSIEPDDAAGLAVGLFWVLLGASMLRYSGRGGIQLAIDGLRVRGLFGERHLRYADLEAVRWSPLRRTYVIQPSTGRPLRISAFTEGLGVLCQSIAQRSPALDGDGCEEWRQAVAGSPPEIL